MNSSALIWERSITTERWHGLRSVGASHLYATIVAGEHCFTLALEGACRLQIGRGEDTDIQVVDATVSRAHANLAIDGETVTVTDLGSRNGTFLDGVRCDQPRVAERRSELRMGDARLLLWRGAPSAVVRPVFARRSFLHALDAQIASGIRPHVFVLQFDRRWYEMHRLREIIDALPPKVDVGVCSDRILGFSVKTSSEATLLLTASLRCLRAASIDANAGVAADYDGEARHRLSSALEALAT